MNSSRRNYLLIVFIGLFVILGCKSCVSPTMEFEKIAEPTFFTEAGQVITYTYIIKNGDGRPVTFNVTDDKLGEINCGSSIVDVNGTVTCQMTYTTTEADVAAGVIKNVATMTGVAEPVGPIEYPEVVLTASAEVVYEQPTCQLELKKTAHPTTYSEVGEVISYTYEIHNIGLSNVSGPFSIADDLVDEWFCDDGGVPFDLCVDCSITCNGTYIVQASDVGSSITNTAHAEGTCQADNKIIASNSASATVMYLGPTATPQSSQPQLTLTKSAAPTVYSKAGLVIIYTYTIKNTGTGSAQGPFTFVDDRIDEWDCDPVEILPAGGEISCQGYYLVRGSDVGSDIINTAHIEGASGAIISNSVSATVYYFGSNDGNQDSENPSQVDPAPVICDPPWSPGCQ
jgi:hypothetical protein